MSDEIEIKLIVTDHDALRVRLGQRGACLQGRALQEEHYFDWPEGQLRSADSGLRVRVIRPLLPESNEPDPNAQPTVAVTFKGPRRQSEMKIREEIEFLASCPQRIEQFLRALGLVTVLHYPKRRETWRLEDCQVCLDEAPYLGRFVEIEGPCEQAVRKVQTSLSLDDAPVQTRSYLGMLQDYRAEHGFEADHLHFD